ncbi:malignant fibrous histiocytoma-amplified sequence 1 homolog [Branchiostoma floridae x Branchiostoma japonicum]
MRIKIYTYTCTHVIKVSYVSIKGLTTYRKQRHFLRMLHLLFMAKLHSFLAESCCTACLRSWCVTPNGGYTGYIDTDTDTDTDTETSTVIIVAPSSTMEQSGSSNSAQIVSSKQRVKLMFVGQTGSGKTSLCLTMIGGKAHIEDKSDRTIGVDIRSYIDQTHGVGYKIYDFGGHDVYHYTHRFFLTHLGLYLLCVDLPGYRSGEFQERVGKWITSISSHVTRPYLIVVGTKSDKGDVMEKIALLERDIKSAETAVRQALEEEISRCQETLDSREQGLGLRGKDDHFVGLSREEVLDKQTSLQKLLDSRPGNLMDVHIVQVSSKRNKGIDVLRAKMAEIVQERIGVSSSRQLPQSWSDFDYLIKQKTSKPYLDLTECKQRGRDVGMENTDVLNALEYLHVMGDILFYRHIQGMEDKVFQDPSIILKLFKQLFRHDMAQHLQKAEKLMATDRQQFLERGVVSEEFVDAVLPKEAESFQLLLPLMKHFGLCFNRTVTMMANVPIANDDEIAAHWSDTVQEGTKEVKLTMKSLDVHCEHPVGLGESLACRMVLMSEEGRRLVKRNAVINRIGMMDVMYRRLNNEEEKRTQQERTSDKVVDEIYVRADNKEAWRGMKELVKKIKPCLEEYQARLSEDRVTVTGEKKLQSIPLEALHKHTGEDLDKIFLGEWAEPTRPPGVSGSDKMNKYMIGMYVLCLLS